MSPQNEEAVRSFEEFLKESEWDAPFFKVLAHNDTGGAAGHQAGMVLPKDLRIFLPSIDAGTVTTASPAADRHLQAMMYDGFNHLTDSTVRYQIQTWGGTRSPESRLTDGFRPIHQIASAGDVLIFQRRADALDVMRMILIQQGTPIYTVVARWVGGRRWGVLLGDKPVTQARLVRANAEAIEREQQPFAAQVIQERRVEVRQNRIARSTIFRTQVRREYRNSCAVSRIGIASPTYLYEVESAHVVPISERGADDIRNGLALSQSLHWAFDKGLFGVRPDRTIYVPGKVREMPENESLVQFNGAEIVEASTEDCRVHPDAFAWHFINRVERWD
jgi:putative restriction endonuclease